MAMRHAHIVENTDIDGNSTHDAVRSTFNSQSSDLAKMAGHAMDSFCKRPGNGHVGHFEDPQGMASTAQPDFDGACPLMGWRLTIGVTWMPGIRLRSWLTR
jgi:hypothetical protein